MSPRRPPRLAARLLRFALGSDRFEPVAGDLEEGFDERAETGSSLRARLWYWRETILFLVREGTSRLPARPGAMSALRDLRFGLRVLRRQPGFALAAIAVMALGVGAATAVFSVLRGVLLTPLPYRDAGELVLFRAVLPGTGSDPALTSAEFAALRARTDLFASVGAVVEANGSLTAPDLMAPMNAAAVSETFLDTLGVIPALGRGVARGDGSGRRPVNIGYDVWQRYFHARPDIIGRLIDVNGSPMEVTGVLPRGFKAYLGAGVALPPRLDLLYFRGAGYDGDPFRGNVVVARVRRGVSMAAVQAALDTIAREIVSAHPDRYPTGPVRLTAASLEEDVVAEAKPALIAVAGAVLLVLIAACASLANLLLARASARGREMAIRLSIGAGPRDLVRQLLAEALVIGAIGALAGWLIARGAVAVMLALAPEALPRREAIAMDLRVALFATGVALVCAIVSSLVPAWRAARTAVAQRVRAMQKEGRTRKTLVVLQLALSVMLLIGAALLGRAFVKLRGVPLGFEPRDAASLFVSLDGQRWGAGTIDEARARRRGFYEALTDQARQLPGVRQAGAGFPVPLSGIAMTQRVALQPGAPQRDADAFIAFEGYLEALSVRVVAGRSFTRADHARPVVIVDERLASALWPGQSPVGRRVLIAGTGRAQLWADVVGVAAHVRNRSLREAGPPQLWMTYAVRSYAQLNVVARADDPLQAAGQIALAAHRLGSGRPVRDLARLDDAVAEASADTRFALFVLGVLAALSAALATVGVYGVASYAMSRRRREFALRLALGASSGRLIAALAGEAILWTGIGVLAGLAGAAALARYLESLLFEVGSHDLMTFTLVPVSLAVAAAAAMLSPARRAVRIDPALALRGE